MPNKSAPQFFPQNHLKTKVSDMNPNKKRADNTLITMQSITFLMIVTFCYVCFGLLFVADVFRGLCVSWYFVMIVVDCVVNVLCVVVSRCIIVCVVSCWCRVLDEICLMRVVVSC